MDQAHIAIIAAGQDAPQQDGGANDFGDDSGHNAIGSATSAGCAAPESGVEDRAGAGVPYVRHAGGYQTIAVDQINGQGAQESANDLRADEGQDVLPGETALERQDIVVTEERAKQLSAPRDAKGRPILPPSQKGAQKGAPAAAAPVAAEPAPPPADQPEGEKKPIRSVGPKFLSQ